MKSKHFGLLRSSKTAAAVVFRDEVQFCPKLKMISTIYFTPQDRLFRAAVLSCCLWSRDSVNLVFLEGEWGPYVVLWPVKDFILPPTISTSRGNCILRCCLHYKDVMMSCRMLTLWKWDKGANSRLELSNSAVSTVLPCQGCLLTTMQGLP